MIQPGTFLNVVDNSGARFVECIKIVGKVGRGVGTIGDFAVVSVKKLRKKGNIKVNKKEICLAYITQTKRNIKRGPANIYSFGSNTCILLSRKKKIIGSRILGILPKELKQKKYMKILALSSRFK